MLHRITTQIGQTAMDGGRICRQVQEYLAAAHIVPASDTACPDWNGALMAWAAIKDGIVPPVDSGNPMTWLSWGTPLDTPASGAIAILTSGSGRASMACAVVARTQAQKVYVIGAFDDVVQMRAVPVDRVIAVRKPPGATLAIQSEQPQPLQITIHNEAPALPPPVQAAIAMPIAAAAEEVPAVTTSSVQTVSTPPVTMEALQRLLDHVQAEFSDVHARIDQVSQHAVAAVQIEHEKA